MLAAAARFNQATGEGSIIALVKIGRVAGVTNLGSASIVAYTVGLADESLEVSANINIVSGATFSFSLDILYTDETNTARVNSFDFVGPGTGAPQYTLTITNAAGALAYAGRSQALQCKAGTTVTIRTSTGGTFTAVVYNASGFIKRLA